MIDVFKSLIPIIISTENWPKQIGTGVLLSFNDESFILTAAHVYDIAKNKTIYVPTTSGIKPLVGDVAYNQKSEIDRKKDKLDIGYIKISNRWEYKFHEEIKGINFDNIEKTFTQSTSEYFTFCGYPKSKIWNSNVESTLHKYTGFLADEKIYIENDYSIDRHVVINFDINNVVTDSGQKYKPPNPLGISGGGIFTFSDKDNKNEMPIKLVGIAHTYNTKKNLLIGTSIGLFIDFILQTKKHFKN